MATDTITLIVNTLKDWEARVDRAEATIAAFLNNPALDLSPITAAAAGVEASMVKLEAAVAAHASSAPPVTPPVTPPVVTPPVVPPMTPFVPLPNVPFQIGRASCRERV